MKNIENEKEKKVSLWFLLYLANYDTKIFKTFFVLLTGLYLDEQSKK